MLQDQQSVVALSSPLPVGAVLMEPSCTPVLGSVNLPGLPGLQVGTPGQKWPFALPCENSLLIVYLISVAHLDSQIRQVVLKLN